MISCNKLSNGHKVHFILNEMVMGGMVLELNEGELAARIQAQDKKEDDEVLYYVSH